MDLRAALHVRRRVEGGRRRLRRTRRALAGQHRMVVVPLLEHAETRRALEIGCRLAADRGSHVLVLAPLFVELELPLEAHFAAEEAALREELAQERELAEAFGVRVHTMVVRVRHGELGRGVAEAADEVRASLIVLGAPVETRHGFRRPFSRDVWSVLHDSPCPVLIATDAPGQRVASVAA